ncbi:MAG: aerobic carbon-monoxide dehydrogenase small subunit [Chloroflexota bacterium]|jgi:carbon-monoxide dehydrogenase small subunit|nr:aerobic carbon-monoxide dehydrogenase small subunit [Chloroflexota bacterium]
MHELPITVRVNGSPREAVVEPRLLLVHLLRDVFGLTGTHIGCDTTSCGACTVLVDGRPVKSCTMFAVQADDLDVMTIEGVADGERLHPLQQGFYEEHGLQCGFCTPGMILAAMPLLEEPAAVDDHAVRRAISGNLCRCTGYDNIVRAIQWGLRAASQADGPRTPPAEPQAL